MDLRLFSAVSADLKRRHWHPPGKPAGLLPSLQLINLQNTPEYPGDAPLAIGGLDHHTLARPDLSPAVLGPWVLAIPAVALRQASDPHELLIKRSSAEH